MLGKYHIPYLFGNIDGHIFFLSAATIGNEDNFCSRPHFEIYFLIKVQSYDKHETKKVYTLKKHGLDIDQSYL